MSMMKARKNSGHFYYSKNLYTVSALCFPFSIWNL